HFVARPTSAVTIAAPAAEQLLARVAGERSLRFRALVTATDEGSTDPQLRPAPEDGCLDVDADEAAMTRALRNLHRKATAEYLDRGLSVLYLAVGQLRWTEVDGQPLTSPLLLVPATLQPSARGQYWWLRRGEA